MAQKGRGRGRGAAAWEALAARMEAAERERAPGGVGRRRGAALVPAPGVVAGAGHGAGGVGPGADAVAAGHGRAGPVAVAAGHGRAGPVAVAAGNEAGVGGGGAAAAAGDEAGGGGRGRGVGRGGGAAPAAGNALGRWLLGNMNHGANPKKLHNHPGVKNDSKVIEIYSADDYLTGDAEIDDVYIRLASLYNSYGDKFLAMQEKAASGKPSRHDCLKYEKEEERLIQQIRVLQQALRTNDAKAYPLPKILRSSKPF